MVETGTEATVDKKFFLGLWEHNPRISRITMGFPLLQAEALEVFFWKSEWKGRATKVELIFDPNASGSILH